MLSLSDAAAASLLHDFAGVSQQNLYRLSHRHTLHGPARGRGWSVAVLAFMGVEFQLGACPVRGALAVAEAAAAAAAAAAVAVAVAGLLVRQEQANACRSTVRQLLCRIARYAAKSCVGARAQAACKGPAVCGA